MAEQIEDKVKELESEKKRVSTQIALLQQELRDVTEKVNALKLTQQSLTKTTLKPAPLIKQNKLISNSLELLKHSYLKNPKKLLS